MEFEKILCDRYGLSNEAVRELMQHAELICFGKKECVLIEGQRDDYAWLLAEGSTRSYVMREDKCVILFFSFEGDPATWMLGDTGSPHSRYTIQTMEASTLLRIPRTQMERLFALSVELSNMGRRMTERMMRINEDYFAEYSWRDKGAQYLRILREYPSLLQRVPLKDLAAYLFVTPQTLSRIRSEIK